MLAGLFVEEWWKVEWVQAAVAEEPRFVVEWEPMLVVELEPTLVVELVVVVHLAGKLHSPTARAFGGPQ